MDTDKAGSAFEKMAGRKMNCAQSVFSTFSGESGVDPALAMSIAQGFGGGMHIDSICGAVTGAYMALGLANPVSGDRPRESMDRVNALIKEFNHRFLELYGSLNCTELTGYDLSKPEEAAKARETGVFTEKCPNFVRDAAEILESLLISS